MDVDSLHQILALHARPYADDSYLLADVLMPTLIAALAQAWEEGHDAGMFEWAPDRPGNPYGPEHYPDWPRRRSADR